MGEDYKKPKDKRKRRKSRKKYEKRSYTREEQLEHDLKKCMRCRYFYGNNHQCIQNKCVKEEKPKAREQPNECIDCSYKMQGGYCFPCMKKLLGQI